MVRTGAHSAKLLLELHTAVFALHARKIEGCVRFLGTGPLIAIVGYFVGLSFLSVNYGYSAVKIDFYRLVLRDLSVSNYLAAFNLVYAVAAVAVVLAECIICRGCCRARALVHCLTIC